MKSICAWFIIFWLNWSFAAVGSANVKTKRLAARVDPIPIDSTTAPAPIEATTALVEVISNKTSNSTAVNNTIFYDHKHKILLVVLSDLNVREAHDGQQSNSQNFITNHIKKNLSVFEKKLGKKPTDSHNARKKILNETFLLEEKWLTDLLKKLQTTSDQDQEGATNGVEIKKCVNIVPHYVPPTFPWLIRKQQSKPIVYVEPIACEDTAKVGGVGSWENKNRKRRIQRTDLITNNIAHPRSRPLKSARKRQRSKTDDYVLMPRFGAAQEMTHLKYPFN